MRLVVRPTPTQLFWTSLLSIMTLVVVYRNAILERIAHGQAVPIDVVSQTFKAQLASLNQYQFVQTGIIVAFWALVGLCAFAVYAAVRNSGSTVMDEVTIRREYTNTHLDLRHFAWVGLRLGAALALLVTVQIVWRAGLPFLLGLAEQFFLGSMNAGSFLMLVLAFVGLALCYYVIWILLYIAIIADRIV